jgi:hypothetical protein
MLKRIALALLITTSSVYAQTSAELQKRLDELKGQIDILTQQIEAIKLGEKQQAAQADVSQYGLGAAASKVYRSEPGVSFGGYGEFLYDNPRHGIATADVVRAVLYTGYKFNDKTLFNSELEVEHATTEIGGTVSVEFAYLDFLHKPQANARAGLVLIPMGLINEQHEPTAYLGARRPEVEDRILPTTWTELGAGMFGDVGSLTYRGYVVTGLDSRRFTAEDGVHEGKQSGSEARAKDLAFTGRLDWHPVEGVLLGASAYSGNSGQGAGFRGRVTLADLHADAKFRGISLRGLVAKGKIGDAAAISAQNGQTIGSSLGGWYVEGSYDLPVSPYVRYERLDTQRRVPLGFERDPLNDRRITTLGVSFKPIAQTVIKTDYQKIKTGAGTDQSQFNIALGYIF